MSLQNIKSMKSERGFTIVELLIVIVVIAILAAITIVAYNGIQQRAKNSSYQDAASQLQTKVEAWVSIKGSYPATTDVKPADGTPGLSATDAPEAKLDQGLTDKVAISGSPSDSTPVVYAPCGTAAPFTGATITYLVAGGTNVVLKRGTGC